jgi:hypothetical protein
MDDVEAFFEDEGGVDQQQQQEQMQDRTEMSLNRQGNHI